MASKSIEAKVICRGNDQYTAEQKKQFLWLTHQTFNEGVRKVLPYVFKMKRGELGEEFQAIYYAISTSQDAIGKLEAIVNPEWKTKKIGKSQPDQWRQLLQYREIEREFREKIKSEGGKSTKKFRRELKKAKARLAKEVGQKDIWAAAAAILRQRQNLLFNRDKVLPNLPSEFRRKIYEMTIQLMHGNQELIANWEDEHAEWLMAREKWEEENPEYIKVRPILERFEKEQGKVKGSRIRWLAYLDYLSSHSQLAAWRGGKAEIIPLTSEERKSFRKPRQHFEAFFKKNPEIAELDKKHNYYQREFARTQSKRSRHLDGFKHKPTFTLPSATQHPAWYSFKKNATYDNLDLGNGSIDLKLLTGEGENIRGKITYQFEADSRLKRFRKVGTKDKGGKAKSYLYADPILDKERKAEIKGIKLIFRPARPDGIPYLVFTCDIEDEKPTVKIWKEDTPEESNKASTAKKKSKRVYPPELVTLAIDFGQRHLGAITVCKNNKCQPEPISFLPGYLKKKKGYESKPVKAWLATIPGLSFNALKMHELEISSGMSRRFKDPTSKRQAGAEGKTSRTRRIPEDEKSWAGLRDHIAGMKEDFYKKAAHLIVQTALQNGAQVILIENLKNYRPMLEKTNKENRRRMIWAVRKTAEFLEATAKPLGLQVMNVSPAYTSRMCSACGHPGARASLPAKNHWKKFYSEKLGQEPKMIVDAGGKFFCCPNCKKILNADVNASLNMHKVFYQTFVWPDKTKGKEFTWNGKESSWEDIAQEVEKLLHQKARSKEDIPY